MSTNRIAGIKDIAEKKPEIKELKFVIAELKYNGITNNEIIETKKQPTYTWYIVITSGKNVKIEIKIRI